MNILYIGPNDSEWAEQHCQRSVAASQWSRGFLSGVAKAAKVVALTHSYYYPWPKGSKLWSGYDARLYPREWDCEVVSYPVARYLREWWWKREYARKAARIVVERAIDAVVVYNCYEPWVVKVLKALRAQFPKLRIVPIILDGSDPRRDDWQWIRNAADYADAFIVLSRWMQERLPTAVGRPSYHLDGGAICWHGSKAATDGRRLVVYAGELSPWSGVDFLISIIRGCARNDIEFVICGRTICREAEVLKSDPRVHFTGYLKESELDALCSRAEVFLNIRDPQLGDNILNFPSKLPRYLSYGKPVVSNSLASLSKDYDEFLFVDKGNTVEGFLAQLDRALALEAEEREELEARIKTWFCAEKLWDAQGRKLVRWLEREFGGCKCEC